MFKAKVEGDTKTKRTTAHKDRQSITKVHQNNWHERLWNDKLEQNSKGRQRISQCKGREDGAKNKTMHAPIQTERFCCHSTRDKNEPVHTFRQQSSFSSLWAVTKGKYPAFTVHSIYSCREWKSNQELRGTSPHRTESSAGILDQIQGFVVCWLVIYFSASANNLSSPRNQMIYQQKLDF